ncbi:uncharacterized protein DDB_G0281025-like [Oppia nitens]|uniref:uncharacterized protein DDB_G0281025-like n=1 Tax=Oppia nitens TaxID=1686743 RepID=UPI0023DB5E23|nr:uncharacterized protein DDB_G0281025-like [Oppia nitens]
MANNSDGNTITIENINNPYIKDISVTTKQNINNNFDINSKANKCNNSQTVTEKQQQQQREPIVLATSASSDKHQEYSVSGIKPLVEQCLTSVLTNCAISSIKPKEGQLAVNKTNTSAVNISTAPESTITSISSDITPNIVNLPKTSTNVNHNNETKKLLTNISSTVSPGAQQTTVTYSSLQPGVGRQKATKNSAPGSDTTITTTNTTTTTTITNSSTSQPKSISPLPLWTLSSRFPIAKYSSFGANNQLTLPSITLTDLLLDIKVKSVEATLIPLVNQV